ncbi:MAG: hypothetical protein ACE5GE_03480 [Phycisphaerae bacterium]
MNETSTSAEFNRLVLQPLGRQARRLRAYLLAEGLALLAVLGAGAATVQLLLDWLWHLPVDMRAALLALALVILGVAFWRRIVRPLTLTLDPPVMARLIEHRFPQLNSVLISAVRFQRGDLGPAEANSPRLAQAVIHQAGQHLPAVNLTAMFNRARVRRSGGIILAVLAAFALAFLAAPQTMGLWFDRSVLLGDTPWPKKTRIVVDLPDGVLRGARGDDLEVRAHVPEGYQAPRLMDVVYTLASGNPAREQLTRVGDRAYRFTFANVQEEFEFYLQGGDDRTAVFAVKLTERPSVLDAELHVTPPAYTRRNPYRLGAGRRSVELLPGSRLDITISTNKPVTRADLLSGKETIAQATSVNGRWSVSLEPQHSQTFHFQLTDADEFTNKQPARFAVRMLKDHPPRVRMKVAGAGDSVTPEAVLPVELDLADDFGLALGELVYQVKREGEVDHVLNLKNFSPGSTQFQDRMDLPISSLPVIVGDSITLFARATDFDDVSGPNQANSTAVSLRIVTREELLNELARREQEYRRNFERAVDAQEDLRRTLLSAVDRLSHRPDDQNALERLASAERRQRLIAGQVNGIRQQFEQVLAQLRLNRLADPATERRIDEGIIGPLTQMAKRDLVSAADAIRRLSRDPDAERASALDPQQARILTQMRNALNNMLKWEGFQETVTMLREILRLQKELNAETAKALETQGAEIFGDD